MTALNSQGTSQEQLIPEMIEIANNETINFFSCKKDDVFIDLYCGIGSMARKMSFYTNKTIGIE